ncbi:Trehalose transport system permease protein SugB [Streptomyces sp. YIM 130001]|uniref:carbohydrate ABC transporter permease n=1 Tax=Streptomyces sp. YIM 130001 TaxID=2259644 RepID=UPI000E65D671|nr:carbohydrate ABC transporter permease [Streptomyces sp. YIM 130001]RII16088.1 Trehalose transport system permease protein SugB [Streptomyces sp. YIM 130001]
MAVKMNPSDEPVSVISTVPAAADAEPGHGSRIPRLPPARPKGRRRTGLRTKAVAYGFLALAALFALAPFLWVGLASVKRPIDAFSLPPVWDFSATLEAYRVLWYQHDFATFFMNTVLVAVATVVVSLVISLPAAYALARYTKRGALVLLVVALLFRALPRMAVVLPFYYISRELGLYDTKFTLVAVLVAVNQPFTIWLLRNFFVSLPDALEESAMIDGCSRFQAFRRVILPLVRPGLAAAGVFTFLLAYQDYLIPVILTQSNAVTLPVFIAQFSTENIADWPVISAASVSLALPVVALILLAQRWLVAGLTAGSVKG